MVIILINKVIFIFFIPISIYSIYIWITKVPYYSKQQITITKLEREVKNLTIDKNGIKKNYTGKVKVYYTYKLPSGALHKGIYNTDTREYPLGVKEGDSGVYKIITPKEYGGVNETVKNFREFGFVIALFTIGWIITIIFKQLQALIRGKIKDV